MHVRVVQQVEGTGTTIANENRELLRRAGVFSLNLIGAAGCGKTSLLRESVTRMMPRRRIGVIACDPQLTQDADRLAACSDQIVQVDTGEGRLLQPRHLQAALAQLDLGPLDLLLIENVSSTIGPAGIDLGESAKAAVFDVSEGDEKAAKYADLVDRSSVIVLNKMDLLPMVSFDVGRFRRDVARLGRGSPLFELSVTAGEGMEPWMKWLDDRIIKAPSYASSWFG